MRRINANAGFTLVELIVVMAIFGIVLGIAVINFPPLIAEQRIQTVASSIQLDIVAARSEAIKRNVNIVMAPLTVGQWNAGWTIANSSTGVVYTTHPAVSTVLITGPASVVFHSSGRTTNAGSVKFNVSSSVGVTTQQRCVEVQLSGIPIVTSGACT